MLRIYFIVRNELGKGMLNQQIPQEFFIHGTKKAGFSPAFSSYIGKLPKRLTITCG
jgi:hypothetical protein